MMRLSTNWQNFEVDLDDATFIVSPMTGIDKMLTMRIMLEINEIGIANFYKLSPDAQEGLVEMLKRRVVDWKGVTDERGQVLPYDPRTLDLAMAPEKLFALFFKIDAAARLSDVERKNSVTASPSASQTPGISTADSAANAAPTPAGNPAA